MSFLESIVRRRLDSMTMQQRQDELRRFLAILSNEELMLALELGGIELETRMGRPKFLPQGELPKRGILGLY